VKAIGYGLTGDNLSKGAGYDPLEAQTMMYRSLIWLNTPRFSRRLGRAAVYSSRGYRRDCIVGEGCARAGFAGVYARVDTMQDFIDGGVCDLSSNPPATCSNTPPSPPAPTPPASTPTPVNDSATTGIDETDVDDEDTTFDCIACAMDADSLDDDSLDDAW
jgi:hypothetical protein